MKVVITCFVSMLCFAGYASAAKVEKLDEKSVSALKTGLAFDVQVGLGYDSNIYKAPGSPYINYADSCSPGTENCVLGNDGSNYIYVDPQIYSGGYVPAELDLDYVVGAGQKNFLVTSYKFDGELYLDSKYDNANNYSHKFRIGDEYVFENKGSRTHGIYVGGLYEHKKRLYLDRDTGEEQTSSGDVDISNRYTYDAIGVEADYQNHLGKWQYDVEAKWSVRDYEDPVAVSQYDHIYYLLGGDLKYQIAKQTKLSVGYQYYVYDYDERPARDADGDLSYTVNGVRYYNPPREYEYDKFDVTLRQRISKSWLAYLDYERKKRTDKFVGYDNYTKDLFKVRVHYDVNKNNKIKVSLESWTRDYPNAYAFDNPSQEAKSYDGVEFKVSSSTQLDKSKAINVDFEYVDENSTDLRYDYDRYKAYVSFQWEYL